MDQINSETIDKNSFWSIMENEAMHAHLRLDTYRLTEVIDDDKSRSKPRNNQRTS